ncbi:MAG: demethylmenaquinone methyltransferase [Coriobacteriales bacterium]|jgi:demethylmenaquinone methyltransferase/2-methoxy-6-polyprenyl-1,4-benzoquinol methylase|nr:demethylmenaquinone methyltransferase [Coriobacteriales bacterium]
MSGSPRRHDGKEAADSVGRYGEKEQWVHTVFEGISDRYDLMNDLESFGLHRLWKRELVRRASRGVPSDVLDIACGTGDIALALARALTGSRIVGLDFSANMLQVAQARMRGGAAHGRLTFVEGNASAIPFGDGSFDVATMSFGLRNMADYAQVLAEAYRVLRPGGKLLCLEASYPTAPVVRPVFRVYFKHLLPLLGGIVTKRTKEYRWLNDSTEAFVSKPQLAALFEAAGFSHVSYRSFLLGAAALHQGRKP